MVSSCGGSGVCFLQCNQSTISCLTLRIPLYGGMCVAYVSGSHGMSIMIFNVLVYILIFVFSETTFKGRPWQASTHQLITAIVWIAEQWFINVFILLYCIFRVIFASAEQSFGWCCSFFLSQILEVLPWMRCRSTISSTANQRLH